MTIFAFGRRYSNQVEKVHLKDKDGEIERDREEVSDSQAHFGKALMQSKLGSARILLGAFNDSSSFSSSSWSSSSSLHPFDRSRCIPRDIATVVPLCARLVSSLLFIAAGSRVNRTNGSMADERAPPQVSLPRAPTFGMYVFKSVSATIRGTLWQTTISRH